MAVTNIKVNGTDVTSLNPANCTRAAITYDSNGYSPVIQADIASGSTSVRIRSITESGCTQTGTYSKIVGMTLISGNTYRVIFDLSDIPYDGPYRAEIGGVSFDLSVAPPAGESPYKRFTGTEWVNITMNVIK